MNIVDAIDFKFNGKYPIRITSEGEVVWQRPAWETETQDILDYATLNGYSLPSYSYIVELNYFIWNLKRFELWDEVHDLLYWMKGDGDLNFKCINLVNISISGTPNGGLINELKGIKGNPVDGWINTNFNPSLLVAGQKYQLNDARLSFYIYDYTPIGVTNSGVAYIQSSPIKVLIRLSSIANSYFVNSGNSVSGSSIVTSNGFKTIQRDSDTSLSIYGLNNKEAKTNTSQPPLPSGNFRLFRSHEGFGAMSNGLISIGSKINLPQHQLLEWATEGKLTAIRNQETVDLIKYAVVNNIKLPTIQNLYKTDRRIHNLKKWGLWTNIFDVLYLLDGDGEANFRALNIVKPEMSGTPVGGLILTPDGVEGNGVDGYINTNFNPSLLVAGQKYQLNDASRGAIVFDDEVSTTDAKNNIDGVTGNGENTLYNLFGTVNHRINQGTNAGNGGNTSGLGLTTISRYGANNVNVIKNNTVYTGSAASTTITNKNQWVLRAANNYSVKGLSTYFMGKSVTLPQTQIFTHILNGDIEKIHNAETKAVIEYAMEMGYKLPTLPYLIKLDEFIQDIKEKGLWGKYDLLYAMVGDGDLSFKCINLVNPALSGTPIGGLVNGIEGIRSNAVDGYIKSNIILSGTGKYKLNDAHRSVYLYTPASGTSFIGGTLGSSKQRWFRAGNGANSLFNSVSAFTPGLNTGASGLHVMSRDNPNTITYYINDTLTTHTQTSNVASMGSEYIYLALDSSYGSSGISTASLGSALTFEESQLLRQVILKYIS